MLANFLRDQKLLCFLVVFLRKKSHQKCLSFSSTLLTYPPLPSGTGHRAAGSLGCTAQLQPQPFHRHSYGSILTWYNLIYYSSSSVV